MLRLFHALILMCSSVGQMNETEFDRLITEGTGKVPYFLMFTKEDCHYCKHAFPDFEETETSSHGIAEFYTIDTTQNPNLTQRYQVFSLPTFGLFFRGYSIPFQGRRAVPSFTKFLIEQISMLLLPVNESWATNNRSKVILFAKRRIPPTILAAAYGKYYKYDIDFGMTGKPEIMEQYQNVSIPMWYFENASNHTSFDNLDYILQLYKEINQFFNISETKTEEPKKADYDDL